MEKVARIKEHIIDVVDFPKTGVIFKDWTPILKNPHIMKSTVNCLAKIAKKYPVDYIVAPEARGFWIGLPVAQKLKKGFIPVRKPGKLPRPTESCSFELEYGTDKLEIHKSDVMAGAKILVIDDVLATAGTAVAIVKLLKKLGSEVVGTIFLMELEKFNGKRLLDNENVPVESLIKY